MSELRPSLRAVVFAAALAVVLVAALGIGRLVGPVDVRASEDEHSSESEHAGEDDASGGHGETHEAGHSEDYRLELPTVRMSPGTQRLAFTVVGPDGP